METQALGFAPRESCAFSWLCLHVGPNAPAWINLFFTFSFSSLRLFLLVFVFLEISFCEIFLLVLLFGCFCVPLPFFPCLFLLLSSSFFLLWQVFLDIWNTFSFSLASGGQMVTREMCRWLKQMFLSKSKYLTPEFLLDSASDEYCRNGGQGLAWLLFTLYYFNLTLRAFRRNEGCWEKLLLFSLPC